MENPTCRNCEQPVSHNFCAHCGQRTATHRIDMKHLFTHDILHGVWHLEHIIVFTIQQSLLRPGKAALEYLDGKRVRFYNVFYLSLMLLGIHFFFDHLYTELLPANNEEEEIPKFAQFLIHYLKYVMLGCVPFLAMNGYVIMDRMRMNLAEHIIMAGIMLVGMLTLLIPMHFLSFLIDKWNIGVFFEKLWIIWGLAILLFPVWAYINAGGTKYKWWEYTWRFLLFYLLWFFEIIICAGILMAIIGIK